MIHRCAGDDCPTCERAITERERPRDDRDFEDTGLVRGADWHRPIDMPLPKGW